MVLTAHGYEWHLFFASSDLLLLIVIEITSCDSLLQDSVIESLLILLQDFLPALTLVFFLLLITVLPKFEVQVKMPKKISFLEDEFEVSVCSL